MEAGNHYPKTKVVAEICIIIKEVACECYGIVSLNGEKIGNKKYGKKGYRTKGCSVNQFRNKVVIHMYVTSNFTWS